MCEVGGKTPRRSPRIASKRALEEILTPSRSKLRCVLGSPDITSLDEFRRTIEGQFTSLKSEVATYEEDEKLFRCLLVTRKVKLSHTVLGPFDSLRLIIKPDRSFKLYVFDKVLEEGSKMEASNPVLSRINDSSIVCCPGIPYYQSYQSAIGFEPKGVSRCFIPPGNARHDECPILFSKGPKKQSKLCLKCLKLKKRLVEMKSSHENMSVEHKESRTLPDSKVPTRFLSPSSKEKKMENVCKERKVLRKKNERLMSMNKKYELEEIQRDELSALIKAINGDETSGLNVLCDEAESSGEGRGHTLRSTWMTDVMAFKEFSENQENTSEFTK